MRPQLRHVRSSKVLLWPVGLAACLVLTACDHQDWNPERLAGGVADDAMLELKRGQGVYARYCVGCHGEEGDGNGPAARFLEPKPRDFRMGRLKFAAVESGEAPAAEDYDYVLKHGLMGTSMPRFDLLSNDDRRSVIAYIRSFYTEWAEDGVAARITLPADPWADAPADGIAAGERLYHSTAGCWSCHPAYVEPDKVKAHAEDSGTVFAGFRPGMYHGEAKDSSWGAPIKAPDFLVDRVKAGTTPEALARTIGAGVGGTAMPTWANSLKAEQLWGLAWYVSSLTAKRGKADARAQMDQFREMQP